MIDPATLKATAQAAIKIVTDEEARKKVIITIVVVFTAIVLFLCMCFYILMMPFQILGNFFVGDDLQKAQDLRTEQRYDQFDSVNNIDGEMRWAVDISYNYISSGFTYRINPITGKGENHRGIDIPAPYGANVYAALDGTVIISQWNSSYGNYIILDNGNGMTTLYAHNSALLKKVGDKVLKGETIALVGSTGDSTGNHCHFEVRINNIPKNPLDYVKQP